MQSELRVTYEELKRLAPEPEGNTNQFWYAQNLPGPTAKLANMLNRMGVQLTVTDTRVDQSGQPLRLPVMVWCSIHKFVHIGPNGEERVIKDVPVKTERKFPIYPTLTSVLPDSAASFRDY